MIADFAVNRWVAHVLQGHGLAKQGAWFPNRPTSAAVGNSIISLLERDVDPDGDYMSSDYQSSQVTIDSFLEHQGLRRDRVSGDSLCLFRTLATLLNSSDSGLGGGAGHSAASVREDLVGFLRQNPEISDGSVDIRFKDYLNVQDWDEYLEFMARPDSAGDYVVLVAAANRYNVALWCVECRVDAGKPVIDSTMLSPLISQTDGSRRATLRLVNINRVHFDPVVETTTRTHFDPDTITAEESSHATAGQVVLTDPFQSIMHTDGSFDRAVKFGERTVPGLRRIVQFVPSRLPFCDLPW
jgi:hypothetical protein